jgi:HlyD family secretion protein
MPASLPKLRSSGVLVPVKPMTDDPEPDSRIGWIVAAAFFVGFLGWAAFARLDAAAYAAGQVSVAGHRQSVQHRDGGIVSAIHVKEGQEVQAGDVVIELNGGEVAAQESALAAQVLSLQAQRARLQAEEEGASAIAWPPELTLLTGPDGVIAARVMKVQQTQFGARGASLTAQENVLRQRSAELSDEIQGYERQIASADEQNKLLTEELTGTKALADKGYAPMTRVRALERDIAALGGQRGQYVAQVAQAREQAGETALQVLQLRRQKGEDVAGQLRDIDFQLGELTPKLDAARDQLARTQVKSPATGQVVGLSVFTVGGVVEPGAKLMDIVPDRAALVISAQVAPADADDLHVGQKVEVRFTGARERGLPILIGSLTKLSADSFTDEKTGRSYFQCEAVVPPAELHKLAAAKGRDYALRPGLPVQLLIPLKARTALDYLVGPLTDSLWRSFREK